MHSSASEVTRSNARTRGQLLRILGVSFGIAVIVGNSIGSAILLTPGHVAAQVRSPWIVLAVWGVGGVFAVLCTQTVCELGTMLPQAGGWFVYARRAFGKYGGFVVGCCDWMVQTASIAFLAVAFGEFAGEFEPALRGHANLVGLVCLAGLTLLNWIGLKAGSRAQEITSLTKALGLIAFVVACFVAAPRVVASSASAPPSLLHLSPLGMLMVIMVALQPIVVTYDGWYGAIYFTEEDEDPARNLPRSSLAGVLVCGGIFLLVNAALLHVLPFGKLAASQMPVADAAEMIFGSQGRMMILLVSVIAAISTINAELLLTPRILFAMAREGLMPEWAASVNAGGTPTGALLLCAAVSGVLVLSGSFETLVAMASILFVVVYLSGFLAMVVLRAREPELPRPYRMWGYPWTVLLICAGTGAFLVASVFGDLRHALFTLGIIGLTGPLYLWIRRASRKQEARGAAGSTVGA